VGIELLPPVDHLSPQLERSGFRFGAKGTHTSRTIMFNELSAVLDTCPAGATREDLVSAIVEGNCLGKQTIATRRLSCQRLSELYSLNPTLPVFHAMLQVWHADVHGRPLLALLCGLARDPLLRSTLMSILALTPGSEFHRDTMRSALRQDVGSRLNEPVLDKVLRNAASSWTQSGHLVGRTLKRRQQVKATPGVTAYAIYLAHVAGYRGSDLFSTAWTGILDSSPSQTRELALEAKRMRLLDLRISGDVVEVGFRVLDPMYEGG